MAATNNENTSKEASLTNSMGMGGLVGGGGYSAQERYIVCHAPEWIFREGFTAIWPEGTGDVDVLFENLLQPYGEHIQVKDYSHNLTPTDLRKIVEGFVLWDKQREHFYKKYTIATPSLNSEVSVLWNKLSRIRDAPNVAITSTEIQELDDAISEVGLTHHADFIKSKLHFHTGIHDLGDDKTCFKYFKGALLDQKEYELRSLPGGRTAYEKFLIHVQNSKGKTTELGQIRDFLELAFGAANEESAVNLVIHNWETHDQDFGEQKVHELDWTDQFDRGVSPRVVPSAEVWNTKLIPELGGLKKQFRAEKAPEFIRFRGRCALSTGFAVGATFPHTGGWTIETPQPDIQHLWRTNPPVSQSYQPVVRFLDQDDGFPLSPKGNSLLVIACITQISTGNIQRWFEANEQQAPAFKAVLEVQPHGGADTGSIKGASDAASFAWALRKLIKEQNGLLGTDAVHLFYNGPQALSVMLGHWLTSVGTVHLYEFLQPGYSLSCTLQT